MAAIKNRRRGPDTMVRMITFISAASWILIVVAFFIYQMTQPGGISYNSIRQSIVDFGAGVIIAKVLLFLDFLLCLWGMGINMMRNRRKSDRFRISLILSAIASLGGFILMMVFL